MRQMSHVKRKKAGDYSSPAPSAGSLAASTFKRRFMLTRRVQSSILRTASVTANDAAANPRGGTQMAPPIGQRKNPPIHYANRHRSRKELRRDRSPLPLGVPTPFRLW